MNELTSGDILKCVQVYRLSLSPCEMQVVAEVGDMFTVDRIYESAEHAPKVKLLRADNRDMAVFVLVSDVGRYFVRKRNENGRK